MPDVYQLPLKKIRIDGGTQSRVGLCEEHLEDLLDQIKKGVELDAIEVVSDSKWYWPWDGLHRVEASARAGHATILAHIRHGTQRDAVLLSCGANARHGLKRTNADKRQAVKKRRQQS